MTNKLLAFFTIIIAFSRSSIFDDVLPASIFYGWFVIIAMISLIRNSASRKINLTMLLFLIVCFISIVLNEINPFFTPWQRFFGFLIFIMAVGPFFEDNKSLDLRAKMFKYSKVLIITVTLISFLGFSTGSSMFFNRSGFTGITNQSMVLGPIAGFSTIITLNAFFTSQKKQKRLFYLVIIIISFLVCLLAASRGALVSLLASTLFLIFITFKNNKKKLFKIAFIIITLFLATSSLWISYAELLLLKNEARVESGDILSGRENMWIDRIEDFKYSPLYGVGFSSMKFTNNSSMHNNGTFEPGSSWLFLLSTLGILGFSVFIFLFFKPIIYLINTKCNINNNYFLICSIVVFFSAHLIIEGYIISTGGFLSFFLWLSISLGQKRALRFISKYEKASASKLGS